jgi:cold shock protein
MSDATPGVEAIVAGFSADLPPGYEARLERRDGELQLFTRHGTEDWVFMVAIGLDVVSEMIPWMLSTCQGELIEHHLGEAWPRCPVHGGHPLIPDSNGWRCPQNGRDGSVWAFGSLADLSIPPDPARRDGEIRWWYDELGWGVIAHEEGDLFVIFGSVNVDGFARLREGQRVDFDVGKGRQGKFRVAEHVTPY